MPFARFCTSSATTDTLYRVTARLAQASVLAALVLAGCGGSSKATSTVCTVRSNPNGAGLTYSPSGCQHHLKGETLNIETGSGQNATTISAAQAAAQDAAAANPNASVPTGPFVIECGRGVSTNGACSFAERVAAAFPKPPGSPPVVLAIVFSDETNTLDCYPHAGGWWCKSRISQVWVQLP